MGFNLEQILLDENSNHRQAMEKINENGLGIVFIGKDNNWDSRTASFKIHSIY